MSSESGFIDLAGDTSQCEHAAQRAGQDKLGGVAPIINRTAAEMIHGAKQPPLAPVPDDERELTLEMHRTVAAPAVIGSHHKGAVWTWRRFSGRPA